MKRWIHASDDRSKSYSIEKKIKDYIAAWAKDNVKNNEPVATYDEFVDELKSEGLKADRDKYDYYITCYNSASKK